MPGLVSPEQLLYRHGKQACHNSRYPHRTPAHACGRRSLDRHRQTELVLLCYGIVAAIGWYRSAQFYIGTSEKTTELNWDSSTRWENHSGLYTVELSSEVSIAAGIPAVLLLC